MKKYFLVSFKYSEDVYCSNLAHAESLKDAETFYNAKFEWCNVREASEYEIKEMPRRGMPIVEI